MVCLSLKFPFRTVSLFRSLRLFDLFLMNCSRGQKILLPGDNFATVFQCQLASYGQKMLTKTGKPHLSNADGLTSVPMIPETK